LRIIFIISYFTYFIIKIMSVYKPNKTI